MATSNVLLLSPDMPYEVDLTNNETGSTETIVIDDCASMDDAIKRVHTERPDTTIDFIGVNN